MAITGFSSNDKTVTKMSSNNQLENSFFKSYKPVFVAQLFVGSARVNVVNNLVSPRFWHQRVYSCVTLALCCVTVIYLTNRSAFYEIDDHWSVQSILSYSAVTTTLFINGFTIIINNFFNVFANCNLMTHLQEIDQNLKITTNECHYKFLYKLNCFLVAFAVVFHSFGNMFVVVNNIGFSGFYLAVPAILSLTAQDLEICFFIGIVLFLILRVKYINSVLDRTVLVKWQSLKHLESSSIICQLFYAYRKIFTVYNLTEITFSHYLFLLVLHMFSNEILALERCIIQRKVMSWATIYQTLMVVLKVYNRILAASLLVSNLEGQFVRTKICCLRVINHTKNIDSRRQAKNILRLVSLMRPMSIFRMFTLNSLPLQLAAVTATYSIVLLQFAFQAQNYSGTNSTETTLTTPHLNGSFSDNARQRFS